MPKKINLPENKINELICLYNSGMSMGDIAISMGRSKNYIRDIFLSHNVPIDRSRSLSKKFKGRLSPRKGKKHSESTILKLKSVDRTNWKTTKGYKFTETQKQKMRDAFEKNREYRLSLLRKAHAKAVEKIKLPIGEAIKRKRQRTHYKNLIRRLIRATGRKKMSKTYELVGYTQSEFVQHIESKFKKGMSWEDRESFHVDHKIPVSYYFGLGITDPKIVNALDNLQPLYPDENRKKSDSLWAVKKDGKTQYLTGKP